jgi:predicted nucleic acid-binding protein
MIVVDSNVIAYLYINSGYSEIVEAVLERDPVWIAPYLWRSEIQNVLVLYIRKHLLIMEDALKIIDEATMLMAHREYQVASHRVLKLAAEFNCSAYDAEFVVLANELDIPLVTVDKQLLSTFPSRALSPTAFLDT